MQTQLLVGGQYVADKNLKLWLDSAVPSSYPGTGSVWYDLSGNRNHGTLVGGLSLTTVLNAITFGFNGTSNRVSFSPYGTPIQSNSTQFTWNCWVKANRNVDSDVILGNRGGNELKFAKMTTQKFEYYPAEVFNQVSTTAWVNLTAVWDGSGTSGGTNMKWYHNGVNVGLRDGDNPSFATGTMNFNIGGDNIAGEYYQGYISMVQVWDRALTATEILNNFTNYAARFGRALPAIGQPYGGGFFAGQINLSGVVYNLIVSPKASGAASLPWGNTTALIGTSVVDGQANTNAMVANVPGGTAAAFCKGLNIGGYTDWYLPSRNEYEVLFYYLKPYIFTNNTSYGANANAVAPEPINTNHTASNPTQTTAINFQTGGSEAFTTTQNWTSTEASTINAYQQLMAGFGGAVGSNPKSGTYPFRAIRKMLAV
jgi:hypothetical protein